MSSVWNFCRWVADFPPRETSPAAKSEEKRMFSQAMNMCLQWHTIPIPAIQYYNKKLNRGQLLWPAVCMLINKVSDDACQWNGHEVVISVGGIFLYRMLCMSQDTRRKVEHSVTLWQQFPLLCTRLLFVVNTLTMFLSFCYIECKLFAVFIKILLTTEGVSAVLLSFMCLWNVPGVGAFDHLNGPYCGAFERHFGPGRGEFEQ